MAVRLKAVFDDGTYIMGDRTLSCQMKESSGTHHLIVTDASSPLCVIGMEVAIPILKPKYWIIGNIKR